MQSKVEQRHNIIKQTNVSDTVLTSNSYQSAVTYCQISETNTVISKHWKDTIELKQAVSCRLFKLRGTATTTKSSKYDNERADTCTHRIMSIRGVL